MLYIDYLTSAACYYDAVTNNLSVHGKTKLWTITAYTVRTYVVKKYRQTHSANVISNRRYRCKSSEIYTYDEKAEWQINASASTFRLLSLCCCIWFFVSCGVMKVSLINGKLDMDCGMIFNGNNNCSFCTYNYFYRFRNVVANAA